MKNLLNRCYKIYLCFFMINLTCYANHNNNDQIDVVLNHIEKIEDLIISGEIPSFPPEKIDWTDGVIRCIDPVTCEREWDDQLRLFNGCVDAVNRYGGVPTVLATYSRQIQLALISRVLISPAASIAIAAAVIGVGCAAGVAQTEKAILKEIQQCNDERKKEHLYEFLMQIQKRK